MIFRNKAPYIESSLSHFPAIAIIGARQVGKTTLVRGLLNKMAADDLVYLDLERPSDLDKLQNAELFFRLNRSKRIIIDEVQRKPELFPLLRYEIDADRRPGRFILLGSSGPGLLHQSSESLAGRLEYIHLSPFSVQEVGVENWEKLWLRGGFPEAFLSDTDSKTFQWLSAFLSTMVERDLPALGLSLTSLDVSRLLSMITHHHGQPTNASQLAKSLGVSQPTVKKAIDFLEQAFVLTRVPSWHTNAKKRIVKSAKVYMQDTGLLHALLGIETMDSLLGHPVAGFSFEGFVIQQILESLNHSFKPFFYRTQDGTECDLVITKNYEVELCVEIKLTTRPVITKAMRLAIEDLKPKQLYMITPHEADYFLDEKIQVIGVKQLAHITNRLAET
jgi:uncharacterized protein